MSDLALCRRSDGNFDLDFDENLGDVKTTASLQNAVAISVGTFARNRYLKNGANLSACIGGWWADAISESGPLGSYLYESFGGKLNQATCASVKVLVEESLSWMMDDGVAKSVNAETLIGDGIISVSIVISKPDGNSETFEFEKNWEATYGV